ncbi:DUF6332 family protein [Streptomyces yangpuensis]|uniref:DUF6332 family protein n=1 Tax=Streptomyces yangpuensis TaxID=1648182 RepID=A0ABY5PQ91_9ACTN|nr:MULTISPECIES: DUF6332 family protein [Streptomyces]MBZ9594037.1 DUF6332 family protein [Streptomyces erythrochromogenes]UUY46170.1 DUF6332 family protein [Streptomyces yangpuensis]
MTTTRQSRAERDAITVEIGYALVSACFLGAVMFGAIAGPTLVWSLPAAVEEVLRTAGAVVAGLLAVLRVVHVLWRFGHPR